MAKREPFNGPFFYFKPLGQWDKIFIYSYLIFSVVFLIVNLSDDNSAKTSILTIYVILMQLNIYLLGYKSLRNLTSYLVWLSFGIFHLLLYFQLKNDHSYSSFIGSYAYFLPNSIILLILFQILRFISIKINNVEFVAPARGGALFDNVKVSFLDYVLLLIYMGSWATLSLKHLLI